MLKYLLLTGINDFLNNQGINNSGKLLAEYNEGFMNDIRKFLKVMKA